MLAKNNPKLTHYHRKAQARRCAVEKKACGNYRSLGFNNTNKKVKSNFGVILAFSYVGRLSSVYIF